MTHTTYAARFPDGVIKTRQSHRHYTHAWRAIYRSFGLGLPYSHFGFSSSQDRAMKAARKVAGSLSNGEAPSIDIVEVEAVGRPAYGSQEWAETYSDDLGESPDY